MLSADAGEKPVLIPQKRQGLMTTVKPNVCSSVSSQQSVLFFVELVFYKMQNVLPLPRF